MRMDGKTDLIVKYEFINKQYLYSYQPGDVLGYFVMRKSFDAAWKDIDKQMGVNFCIYDAQGEFRGRSCYNPIAKGKHAPKSLRGKSRGWSDDNGAAYNSYVIPLKYKGDLIGYLSTNIPQAATAQKIRDTILTVTLITIAILIAIVIGSWFTVSRFTAPIIKMTSVAKAMATGELNKEIDASGKDEIGTLARSFADMRDAIRDKLRLIEEKNIELLSYQECLEQKVVDRTRELEKSQGRGGNGQPGKKCFSCQHES